ncbi:MAG: hypothetical protein JST55_05820 [Bacteroidetes bacterium]|nr:hypothetical protein [Bacteroidota bacterium]
MSYENIKSVLLDTNLLFLYLTGLYDQSLIEKVSRLSNHFVNNDYFILKNSLKRYNNFITTPHILTETSNFLFQGNIKKFPGLLKRVVSTLQGFEQINQEKNQLINSKYFESFGITDTGIIEIAKQKKTMIFTIDSKLWGELRNLQLPYENFNNIRGKNYFQK